MSERTTCHPPWARSSGDSPTWDGLTARPASAGPAFSREGRAQAAAYVGDHVDVIVAFEDKSIAAAQGATALMEDPIPVVFLHPSDPVRDGLVEGLAHPGGKLTGVC